MPVRSTNPEDYQRVPRPVAAMAKEFADGATIAPHTHPRIQLLFAARGVMRLMTAAGAWLVPPLRAALIPAGMRHELRMSGAVAMRTLYIDPASVPWLASECRVLEVSELLRALILGAVEEPVDYEEGSRGDLIMRLILEELRCAEAVPLALPLPRDKRLRALCAALLEDPAARDTLESWADRVGASSRTLVRLFRRETRLSFAEWRQQARLAEAVTRLAAGRPVAETARALGYDSASAFTAMFRRALGKTPRDYLAASAASASTSR